MIKVPDNYPFEFIQFFFKTKIFHPSVFEDGSISLNALNDKWSPSVFIPGIIDYVISMLYNPDMYFGNEEASNLYFYDYAKYWEVAKEWTERFA